MYHVYVCVCECAHATTYMWRSEEKLQETDVLQQGHTHSNKATSNGATP